MQKSIVGLVAVFLIGTVVGVGATLYVYYKAPLTQKKIESIVLNNGGKLSDADSAAAYIKFKNIKENFMPTGTPAVYGKELNISFDLVQEAINKVALFDPTYGQDKIILQGSDMDRYIKIGSQIACEYCCGATALVLENGEAACGCSHSQMMRGLAAYLIKNHPDLSNEKILSELTQWKKTYFPKQMLSAEFQKLEEAGEPGIKEILQEFPDLLPQMVGGC